jgi:hypothetical protein
MAGHLPARARYSTALATWASRPPGPGSDVDSVIITRRMQLPARDAFAGTVLEDESVMSEPVQAAGGDHTIKITVAFLTEQTAGRGPAQRGKLLPRHA